MTKRPSRLTLRSLLGALAFTVVVSNAWCGVDSTSEDAGASVWEIPRDGVVVGADYCAQCDFEQLELRDPDGVLIVGQFVHVETKNQPHWAFVPSEHLAPGTHSLSYLGSAFAVSIEVLDEFTSLPEFELMVAIEQAAEVIKASCELPGGKAKEGEYEATIALNARLDFSIVGASLDQFNYRLIVNDAETSVEESPIDYRPTPEEICYEMFAEPVLGGDGLLLGADCILTGQSSHAVTQKEAIRGRDKFLLACNLPAEDSVDEWCSLFEEALSAESCKGFLVEACESAQSICASSDEPCCAPGGASAQNDDGKQDDEVEDEQNEADGAQGASEDSGCSCRIVPVSHPSPWRKELIFLLPLVGIARRQTRQTK